MRRRDLLTAVTAAGTALLAGCSESDVDTDGVDRPNIEAPDIEVPDFSLLTSEEPQLTETAYQAFSIFDTLAVTIWYDVRDHSHDYSAQITVETEEATSETTFPLQQVRDRYPGIGGTETSIPETSDGFPSPSMTISFLEDGEVVDVEERTLRRL